MKVNDTYPVQIAGQQVANATVKEVGDGTVTLLVPATLVVMATQTEISMAETQESHVEVLGVEENTDTEPVVEPVVEVANQTDAETATPAVQPAAQPDPTGAVDQPTEVPNE